MLTMMKVMKDSAPVGQLQIPGSVSETEGGKSLLRCNTDVNLSRTLGKVKKSTEVQMQYRCKLGQNNSAHCLGHCTEKVWNEKERKTLNSGFENEDQIQIQEIIRYSK